jgi:predicted kinase
MRRFLLQMAGPSGSGKSTLARAIGRSTGAIVIDKDVIKATMLDGGRFPGALPQPEEVAATQSYAVFFALTESLLGMGHSVIMDSPASFDAVRAEGTRMACAAGVVYRIIECRVQNIDELQRRLDNREALSSQLRVAGFDGLARPGTSRLHEPHLTLDTQRPLEECVEAALAYVTEITPVEKGLG